MNKINDKPKFDFDDILIEPEYITNIESRYKDVILGKYLPLFTAPMDTVVNQHNCHKFAALGIKVVLPRTVDYKNIHQPNDHYDDRIFVSLGLSDVEKIISEECKSFMENACILIDVANGHMKKIIDYCKKIKSYRPDMVIMVGNIANPDTYRLYAESESVDYIRVGIGNGGGCLTTKQSGIGFPMASLIHETYIIKKEMMDSCARVYNLNRLESHKIVKYPKIVADGGMKDYSDIIKALALGADYVMVGSIFNKALESCGQSYYCGIKVNYPVASWLFDHGFIIKKHFRGMSTKGAQKAMGKVNFKTSEGVVRYRKAEYHLSGWRANMEHYLRNAMAYAGCYTLEEFIGGVNIIQITEKAHDRFNK